MTAIETSNQNYFSTTLTSSISDLDVSIPLDDLGTLTSPAYLVINPESDSLREVIYADGVWTGSAVTLTSNAVGVNRQLAGSGSLVSGSHNAGTLVTVVPLAQHLEDIHDRIDVHTHDGTTADSAVSHADLANLGANDHPQYAEVAGDTFTGTVLFPDGAAATPSIAFANDTDTGIYRSGANTLDISVAGVMEASFDNISGLYTASGVYTDGSVTGIGGLNATGDSSIGNLSAADLTINGLSASAPMSGANGTAAAPTFSFSGDADTGMFRSAADTLGLAVGATETLRVQAGADPGASLLVGQYFAPVGSAADPTYSFGADTDTGIYRSAPGEISVSTNGTQGVRLGTSVITPGGITIATSIVGVDEVQVSNGTNADPSYTFTNATSMGLFLDSSIIADSLGIAVAGVRHTTFAVSGNERRFYLGGEGNDWIAFDPVAEVGTFHTNGGDRIRWGNGGIEVQAGSQASPSIAFISDSNSGFMSFSNGDFRACINGAYRMQWAAEVAVVNTNFRPDANNSRNCGTSTNAWNTVWRYSSQSPSDPALKSNVQDVSVSSSAEVVRAFRDTGIKEYTYNNGRVGQAGPQGEAPGGRQGGGQGVPPVKTSGLDARINARRHRGVMAPDLHTALSGKVTPEALDTYVIEPDPSEPGSTWGVSYEATIPDLLNVVADLLDRIETLENA